MTQVEEIMRWVVIISSEDGETIYNALRLAAVAVKKQNEVSVFMLGKGVEFREKTTPDFDIMGQVDAFVEAGGELFV